MDKSQREQLIAIISEAKDLTNDVNRWFSGKTISVCIIAAFACIVSFPTEKRGTDKELVDLLKFLLEFEQSTKAKHTTH
jgi:hypothetical protein